MSVRAANRRILVVDDDPYVSAMCGAVLTGDEPGWAEGVEMEALLFGGGPSSGAGSRARFDVVVASSGEQGLDEVRRAQRDEAPFAVAFVDMRMPPGWSGAETIPRIWQEDPHVQAVLCTAYSDEHWDTILGRIGDTDSLLILKKPFEPLELRQMACALSTKWAQQALVRKSEEQTRALFSVLPDTMLRLQRGGACRELKDLAAPLGRSEPPRRIEDLMPEDAAVAVMRCLDEALTQRTLRQTEYEREVSGEVRRFEVRVAAAGDDDALAIIRDVTERRQMEIEAERRRAQEQTIREQAEALLRLSTPLIPIQEGVLLMPLVGILDTPRMLHIRQELSRGVAANGSAVVVLDLTGAVSLDAEVAAELVRTAQAVRMLGAVVTVTGIRPEVAQMLVTRGVDLRGIVTHRDLHAGIAYALGVKEGRVGLRAQAGR